MACRVLLIDNYDSFTYNLYQYIEELGWRCRVVRNDAMTLAQIKKYDPGRIVLSPGPGTPDSSGVCLEVLQEAGGGTPPILGVCLGHQAIGQVFGGRVIRASKMMHGKVSPVKHAGTGLYRGLSNPFGATRYHSLIVEAKTLPSCLEVTSRTEDGTIMGLRHRTLPIDGIQFHPESIMTEGGKQLLQNFLERKK